MYIMHSYLFLVPIHIMATMQEHQLHVLGTCSRCPFDVCYKITNPPPLSYPPGHVQPALAKHALRIVVSYIGLLVI